MESKRFTLRPPLEGDMAWVVAREGAVYSQEFGFDASFEALVARIVNHFAAHLLVNAVGSPRSTELAPAAFTKRPASI